jgi:hypothetical protein
MTFAPPAVAEKEEQDATSLSPPVGLLYTKEDKDTLAYEHDRARHMKTLDRARTKAKKAFAWGNGSALTASKRRDGSYAHTRGKSPKPPVSEEARKDSKEEGRELASEYQPIGAGGLGRPKKDSAVFGAGTPFADVKLADLVVFASSKKSKKGNGPVGKGGLDGDFEIIPHVRSVIVLEDGVGNGELDEGWECVQVEESGQMGPGKSYAKVAAAALEAK